ncbi:hypothetical protein SGLAM104S_05041 [Streptomyces glaucescens]
MQARSEAYLFATDDRAPGQDSPADTAVLPAAGGSPPTARPRASARTAVGRRP